MIATELSAGEQIDGFTIVSRLHSGGMAVIYEVSREDLPGPAVMKVPRLGQGETGATIVGYEVEQMVMEALGGGPVPVIYAAGDIEREPYLVMEKVAGRTLSDDVARAPWPIDEVCRVGAAIADAVGTLHQREAIHLDLKPSNLILRPDGTACLIDLGLAHHAHLPDLLAEEFQRPMGSAPYIAPEQVLGVRSDPRSDIFAIGVMLYEFSTGKLPYGSPDSPNGMRKRLRVIPVPPRAHRGDLPPALQEVILRCMEVDPARRYAAARQLAFDLQHLDQVVVTERGQRTRRDGLGKRMKQWFFGAGYEPLAVTAPSVATSLAPIIVVSVALGHGNEREQQALRREAERGARAQPEARLAFVTVARPAPVMGTSEEATSAPREHLRMLVELRHWAAGVGVAAERVTHHVLEGTDPAETIVNYARANRVDHILIGAPPPELIARKLLPPVSERIAVEAPCSVTIVRAADDGTRRVPQSPES